MSAAEPPALSLLRGALEPDERQMTPAFKELDVERELHSTPSTKLCIARETLARLESRPLVRRALAISHLSRRCSTMSSMRAMLVVPAGRKLELGEHRLLPQRQRETPQLHE